MRKSVLALLLAVSFSSVFAQKLDDVKEKMDKQKWDEAKEKLDKAMENPKNQNNSTAYFYKAQIYQNLSKTHPDDPTYATTSFEAMSNYLKLEQSQPENKRYLASTLEGNKTLFDIYTNYFKAGADAYNNKNYQKSYDNFEKAIAAFTLLKQYNFIKNPVDTTSLLYAGVSAEQMKNKENAIKYYSQLADMKIPDTIYRGIYEYVVDYYVKKKDEANAKKYLAIGETVFPNYNAWLAYELDMAGNDKNQKLVKYEELMQRYPTNNNLALDYAAQYFNYTYSNENKPADYTARQDKLTQILQKNLATQQTAMGNYLMSRHINNQIADLEDQKRAVKGNTPADASKRKDLEAKINQKYDEIAQYSQKAYDLYAQEPNIKGADKVYYREVINNLIDYYQIKKNTAKIAEYQAKLKQLQ